MYLSGSFSGLDPSEIKNIILLRPLSSLLNLLDQAEMGLSHVRDT